MGISVYEPKGFRSRRGAQVVSIGIYVGVLALTLILDSQARTDIAIGAILALAIAAFAWWMPGRAVGAMVVLTAVTRLAAAYLGWVHYPPALQQTAAVIVMSVLSHYASTGFAAAVVALNDLRPRLERVERRLRVAGGDDTTSEAPRP